MKRLFVSIFFIVALGCGAARSQEAFPMLRFDRNPVTSGMAGAGFASPSAGTAFAAFSNPAAAALSDKNLDAGVAYSYWMPGGVKSNNITAGVSGKVFNILGLHVGYTSQIHDPVELSSGGGDALNTVRPFDYIVGGGLSVSILDMVSIGGTIRYASQSLDGISPQTSLSGDIVAMYRWKTLRVGAGVIAMGGKVKDVSGYSYDIPSSAWAGADYVLNLGQHNLEWSLDADYYYNSKNVGVAVGMQYDWKNFLYARAGYRYATATSVVPSHLAIGLGVHYAGFAFDLSWALPGSALAGTVSAGLRYSF